MSVWVIVVAAGSGTRFGGPKQFETLGEKRVIDWSLDVISAITPNVVVVVPPKTSGWDFPFVMGGVTRSESVRAGLSQVPDDASVIVVHDAARPFAAKEMFEAVVKAIESGADAAVPGVPVVDTIKRVSGNEVIETVNRSELVAVQTPQAFKASVLRHAHASGPEASDDAGLVEAKGGNVVIVDGHESNFKITTPRDLLIARTMVDV